MGGRNHPSTIESHKDLVTHISSASKDPQSSLSTWGSITAAIHTVKKSLLPCWPQQRRDIPIGLPSPSSLLPIPSLFLPFVIPPFLSVAAASITDSTKAQGESEGFLQLYLSAKGVMRDLIQLWFCCSWALANNIIWPRISCFFPWSYDQIRGRQRSLGFVVYKWKVAFHSYICTHSFPHDPLKPCIIDDYRCRCIHYLHASTVYYNILYIYNIHSDSEPAS